MCIVIVVTVGFIGAPYSVIESDGMASLTIGLIQGQLAVPVTLNVQLVDGSAQGWILIMYLLMLFKVRIKSIGSFISEIDAKHLQ